MKVEIEKKVKIELYKQEVNELIAILKYFLNKNPYIFTNEENFAKQLKQELER